MQRTLRDEADRTEAERWEKNVPTEAYDTNERAKRKEHKAGLKLLAMILNMYGRLEMS